LLDRGAELADLCALAGAVNPGKAYEFGSLIFLDCEHRRSPFDSCRIRVEPLTRLAGRCMRQRHHGSDGDASCYDHPYTDQERAHTPLLSWRNRRPTHS
jgi:hypothetical protein